MVFNFGMAEPANPEDQIRRLFEEVVDELQAGIFEIKGVAREPGERTLISVFSHKPDVPAVQCFVGPKGARVKSVVEQLGGEKVDIIQWSSDPQQFIRTAILPGMAGR